MVEFKKYLEFKHLWIEALEEGKTISVNKSE